MAEEWDLPMDIFENMLNFMGDIGLLEMLNSAIYIPKLIEKADDWTKREEREASLENVKVVKSHRKAKSTPSKIDDVQSILHYYIDKHKEIIGVSANINWGRDGSIMKLLLKSYSVEELKSFIDEFFKGGLDEECWWADKIDIPVFKHVISQIIGRLRKKNVKTS